jgi:hypothetical protein
LVPDAAFTIFTGDIIDHSIWNTSWDYNEHQSERPSLKYFTYKN